MSNFKVQNYSLLKNKKLDSINKNKHLDDIFREITLEKI